ncbi:hypothetical protein PYCC9005_004036 [Savitreella phatthalungensis]
MFRSAAARTLRSVASRSRVSGARGNASHAGPSADTTNYVTEETFFSPMWRNAFAGGILAYAVYRFDKAYADGNDGKGYFQSTIEYHLPADNTWEERNVKHYNLAKEAAEARLLIQSAEYPRFRQLSYPGMLDHGSPWGVHVDQIVDTSKVEVKRRDL